MAEILSVTSLNLYVKSLLESDNSLFDIAVEGEISNFKQYPSGHCYFTLKDEKSQIKAVLFSTYTRNVSFKPENGMKVMVRGRVSLYERDGAYQLYATNMFLSGSGSYRIMFERIKNKLEKEGLFSVEHKKKLPQIPFKIGVATSAKGAAFHDIISVAKRRFPCVEIVLAPCMVQGERAEKSIVEAIRQLDAVPDIDLIIISRGGGSKEDLWVFNSEAVARAAFECKKPTISAVGHEIDISILDFVCDARAATPTAAAELALPDVSVLKNKLDSSQKNITRELERYIDKLRNDLFRIEKSEGLNNVSKNIELNRYKLNSYKSGFEKSITSKIDFLSRSVISISKIIESQSPLNNLKKGYSLIYKDDLPAKEYRFTVGDAAKIVTLTQEIECNVTKVKDRKDNK